MPPDTSFTENKTKILPIVVGRIFQFTVFVSSEWFCYARSGKSIDGSAALADIDPMLSDVF